MKKVWFLVLSFCLMANVFSGSISAHKYPQSQTVTMPEWYNDFFVSQGLQGQYFSSGDSVSGIVGWYKTNGQYAMVKEEGDSSVFSAGDVGVVVMDKELQLDEETKPLFEKTMILIVTGSRENVDTYLRQF